MICFVLNVEEIYIKKTNKIFNVILLLNKIILITNYEKLDPMSQEFYKVSKEQLIEISRDFNDKIKKEIDNFRKNLKKEILDEKLNSIVKYTYSKLFIFINTFNKLFDLNIQYDPPRYLLNENNFEDMLTIEINKLILKNK